LILVGRLVFLLVPCPCSYTLLASDLQAAPVSTLINFTSAFHILINI
jgi:hypothetical protein